MQKWAQTRNWASAEQGLVLPTTVVTCCSLSLFPLLGRGNWSASTRKDEGNRGTHPGMSDEETDLLCEARCWVYWWVLRGGRIVASTGTGRFSLRRCLDLATRWQPGPPNCVGDGWGQGGQAVVAPVEKGGGGWAHFFKFPSCSSRRLLWTWVSAG